ncbi:subtilisin-chymotrypsin inhibitor-2B-like [Andrographis paniculata]|uniref:subtilisin-chymotrypsin inhibitor-2B-like n=1 Tax=Andrographis paniculata TaxID=175694 RepID=UPI0021E9680A|nr:subtilisin-chymotrypsin inhibitor-2B-like [Andrographis paniculata]
MAEKEIHQQEEASHKDEEGTVRGILGKSTWPELVGQTVEAAETKIKEESPATRIVQVVPPGSFTTSEYRVDRVRIFADPAGKVAKPPRIG